MKVLILILFYLSINVLTQECGEFTMIGIFSNGSIIPGTASICNTANECMEQLCKLRMIKALGRIEIYPS